MDLEKIMLSKAIMDRHSQMDKGSAPKPKANTVLENYDAPQAKYNIPQEFMAESQQMVSAPSIPSVPSSPFLNKGYPAASAEAIKNSKLPDAIKKLMIEHPIEQPTSMSGGVTLSDELVEKASRLMGKKQSPVQEQSLPNQPQSNDLRKMLKEVVQEVLSENGILMEGAEKSNESFKFQVGKHIFEGKLTKIKKLS
jgi:hypothetical protein